MSASIRETIRWILMVGLGRDGRMEVRSEGGGGGDGGGTGELKRMNGAKKDARMIYIVCW